jgi:hypothetical protein
MHDNVNFWLVWCWERQLKTDKFRHFKNLEYEGEKSDFCWLLEGKNKFIFPSVLSDLVCPILFCWRITSNLFGEEVDNSCQRCRLANSYSSYKTNSINCTIIFFI